MLQQGNTAAAMCARLSQYSLCLALFVFGVTVLQAQQQPVLPVENGLTNEKHDSVLPAAPKSVNKLSPTNQLRTTGAEHKEYNGADEDVVHLVKDAKELADSSLGFWHAFVASVSVIIVSELGDKTWFIAAIMAMRHSRLTVFFGAMAALALMTVLSACLGWATQIIPRLYTYYISTALFAIFGLKMLKEGYSMSPNVGQEEYEAAQEDVKKKEEERMKYMSESPSSDVEMGLSGSPTHKGLKAIFTFVSAIFLEAFTLTFLAEWGDRSQLTTIILAARENVIGVSIGGTVGHAICTGIAVIGGRLVAQRISVRTVTLIGGVVFLIFAFSALFFDPNET